MPRVILKDGECINLAIEFDAELKKLAFKAGARGEHAWDFEVPLIDALEEACFSNMPASSREYMEERFKIYTAMYEHLKRLSRYFYSRSCELSSSLTSLDMKERIL